MVMAVSTEHPNRSGGPVARCLVAEVTQGMESLINRVMIKSVAVCEQTGPDSLGRAGTHLGGL